MTREDRPLEIGALIFEAVDQLDVTGPFEVLSHLPDTVFRLYGKTTAPARDVRGLRLLPDARLDDAPRFDVLVVPGGFGQEAVMEDEETLAWVKRQAGDATHVLSVCTGALILGAAGLLKGRRATTHWAVRHLLPFFGAVGVEERVVVDGKVTSTAGVTAGLDGALRLAAALRGEEAAQRISALHGICAAAAFRLRNAEERYSRRCRGRATPEAGGHGAARSDGEAHRREAGN